MPGIATRRACLADAAAVALLCRDLGYDVSETEAAERLPALLDSADHLVLLAEDRTARQTVGLAHAFRVRALELGADVRLQALVARETERGTGIGARLLEEVEAWAAGIGADRVTLSCSLPRENAHRFYAARGYEIEKTAHQFVKPLKL